jgi:hypothetical protein
MPKVLISMLDSVISRMRALIPARQRSRFIAHLVEDELKKREAQLFQAAREVERDETLNAEMKDWDVTVDDGVEHESW